MRRTCRCLASARLTTRKATFEELVSYSGRVIELLETWRGGKGSLRLETHCTCGGRGHGSWEVDVDAQTVSHVDGGTKTVATLQCAYPQLPASLRAAIELL